MSKEYCCYLGCNSYELRNRVASNTNNKLVVAKKTRAPPAETSAGARGGTRLAWSADAPVDRRSRASPVPVVTPQATATPALSHSKRKRHGHGMGHGNGRVCTTNTRSIRFVFAVLLLTPYSLRFVRGNNARVCAVASALTRSKRQWTEENRTAVSALRSAVGQRTARTTRPRARAHGTSAQSTACQLPQCTACRARECTSDSTSRTTTVACVRGVAKHVCGFPRRTWRAPPRASHTLRSHSKA